eukprot:m.309723 g.309723  ORF g.309723 m.309723 type:complete len:160 (+) comp47475_c0_seq1:137-616(+)
MMGEVDESLPDELEDPCEGFHTALLETNTSLKKLQAVQLEVLEEKLDKTEQAKMKLAMAFSLNSLYWAYLILNGVQPKQRSVKEEIERVKRGMDRLKQIERSLANEQPTTRINKEAAKRFVRSSLWEPKEDGERGEKRKRKSKGKGDAEAREKRQKTDS